MFDANKGQQAVADQVDTATDEFAARFADLDPRTELQLVGKLNQLLDNPAELQEFLGDSSSPSTSRPAGALGSGSSSNSNPAEMDEQAALAVLMASNQIDPGVKTAMRRMLDPRDPNPLIFNGNGTPQDTLDAEAERDQLKREKTDLQQRLAAAQQELTDERDERKSGSLAQRLADATAGGGLTAAQQQAAQQHLALLKQKADELSTSRFSTDVDGLDGLYDAIEKVDEKLS